MVFNYRIITFFITKREFKDDLVELPYFGYEKK